MNYNILLIFVFISEEIRFWNKKVKDQPNEPRKFLLRFGSLLFKTIIPDH